MSVKIKMVIGFVIILVMVMVQSFLIVSMNEKRDTMSQQALALFQLNVVMKDRVIDLKTLENDMFYLIQSRQIVPEEGNGKGGSPTSCVFLGKQRLAQWFDAFLQTSNYQNLSDSLKQKVTDMQPDIRLINGTIAAIRKIPESNIVERMDLFNSGIRAPVDSLQNTIADFVGQNSQYFSVQNQSLLSYSEKMESNQKITIGIALLFIIITIFFAQYLLTPLSWLMEGTHRITQGDLTYKVRKRGNDELGQLAEQFNKMTDEIRSYRENLEGLVRQRTSELMEAKEALETVNSSLVKTNRHLESARRIMDLDMQMAVNVQLSFFLKRPPQSNEWEIAFVFLPSAGVAGDLYDFYSDRDGNVTGATVMDVSGHGVASGLLTMIAKSVIFRNFHKNIDEKLSKVMEIINDDLIAEIGSVDNYLTGILLRFKGNMVEYVNAGHTDLLLKHGSTGKTTIVEHEDNRSFKGYFLGLEAMKMPFGQIDFAMERNDTILMFTDCLIESTNNAGEEFGIERLMEAFSTAPAPSVNDLVRTLADSLHNFTGAQHFRDDLTIVAIRRLV